MSATREDEPRHSAARMLAELDFPITKTRDEFVRLQAAFVAAVDPLITIMFDANEETEGHIGFVVRQMLLRAINDLVVAFHLVCHGYLNQGYNVLRIAYEACDILDLIEQDPGQADLWVSSAKPWQDFSPSRVRALLGADRQDPVYSAFCGASHPRFAGAQLTGYTLKPVDEQPSLVLRFGPFLIDENPAIGHAAAFVGSTLGRVATEFGQLVSIGAVTAERYESALRESALATADYMGIVSEVLIARGQPEAADLDQTFRRIVALVAGEDPPEGLDANT
jgi:hypothetical protein